MPLKIHFFYIQFCNENLFQIKNISKLKNQSNLYQNLP